MEQARTVEQSLAPPPTSEALTTLTGAVGNQNDLAKSSTSLLAKVEMLVKVGDELAKVHLCPTFRSHFFTLIPGTSICELCMASALRGLQGQQNALVAVFFF